jgi:hypothetical protein
MSFFKKFNNLDTKRDFVSLGKNRFLKLGQDIDGEAVADYFGYSVSMNAAGDRVAIGAILNDGNGSSSGHVRIYSWNGAAWTQLGVDIDGEAGGDWSGLSVSMNVAGDRVAIGAIYNAGNGVDAGHVRVYSWNGTAWTQLGVDINAEAAGDRFGYSVSMNAAGDRVAIGAWGNDVGGTKVDGGHVRIYSWNGTAWTQLGVDIDGEAANDQFGDSVSMNAAGDRVAIGAWSNDGNGSSSGHVRVYSWNGTAWTQLGVDIDGEAAGDQFGTSVSMNAAGNRVAIGAVLNDGNGVDAGHVRVYSWNGTAWTQLGVDINAEAAGDQFGISVSMNAAGNRVAIGAHYNDGNGLTAGHVRIYSWNGTAWTQLGVDIDGEAAGDQSGYSVSMNAAGDRVAIGTQYNDGNGFNSGHVRIYYDYVIGNRIAIYQLGSDIDGEAAGDESGRPVSMNAAGNRVAIGGTFNDVGGTKVNAGHVRIYELQSDTWTQLGVDIDGEAANDWFGISVSMNAAGDRVAIAAQLNDGINGSNSGHVRIYSWNGTAWTQLGVDIDGEAANDWCRSVSMNAAGDRVAIGAVLNDVGGTKVDAGHVRIYELQSGTWTQLGVDIDGEAAGDGFGSSVSMNAAGDRVAIGAPTNDAGGTSINNRGHVRVYSWNGTAWTQLGVDIDGEAAGDESSIVSMNAAGDRVAIGSTSNDAGGASTNNRGHVRVYELRSGVWTQLGVDIDGEAAGDYSGSVSMNAAGDRVAIGGSGKYSNTGHVRIYSWNGTAWTQLGVNINGEAANDFFGSPVSMNAAGDRVAIAAFYNDVNGAKVDAGHVRVFQINL